VIQLIGYGPHVISLAQDGTARLWDLDQRTTKVVFHVDASCIAVHGDHLMVGKASGALYVYPIPEETAVVSEGIPLSIRHKERVIGIAMVQDMCLSQSQDGTVYYWNLDTFEILFTFLTERLSCRFAMTRDRTVFGVGTPQGEVDIYSLKEGRHIANVSHKRSSKPIRSLAFSRNKYRTLM
jgi:WD40 repeat protein